MPPQPPPSDNRFAHGCITMWDLYMFTEFDATNNWYRKWLTDLTEAVFRYGVTKCNLEVVCLITITINVHLTHEEAWTKAAQWLADAYDTCCRRFPYDTARYEIADNALFDNMLRAWVTNDIVAARSFAQRLCHEVISPMDAANEISVPLAIILAAICKASADDADTGSPRTPLHDEPVHQTLDARFAPPRSFIEFSVYAQSAAARFGLETGDKTISGYMYALYRDANAYSLFDDIVFGPVRAVRESFIELHQELDEHGEVNEEWTDSCYRAVSAEHLPAVAAYLACLGITRRSEAYNVVLQEVSDEYTVSDDELVCHYLRARRAARVIQRAWRSYMRPRIEAARVIQRHALHAWYSPAMPLCQRRLMKEAAELCTEV